MSDPLEVVRQAAAARRAADLAYLAALQAARDAGKSGAAIGEAAGTSRQNILKLTTAPVVDHAAVMRERLDHLDSLWDVFVAELASAMFVHPDAQREQLRRNTENGKRKRKAARASVAARKRGFGPTRAGVALLPTVKSDGRRAAETYALAYIEENPLEPFSVEVRGQLDEAAALREQLSTLTDPSWLHD